MRRRSALPTSFAWIAALGFALLGLSGCGPDQPAQFDTPAAAFSAYKKALEAEDLDQAWLCYSSSFRDGVYKGEMATWVKDQNERNKAWIKNEANRQIADEKIINQRIAYLLFDATTLESNRVSPFFYFIKETEGWKITTHLDSTFHQELEKAIERGEFVLPAG